MAINLYELFHRFYQLGLPAVLGPDGTALYWALIQKSNELRDPAQFTFTNTEARDRTGIDHPEKFDRARQKLIQAGLVTYKAGRIHRTGIYSRLDRELDPNEVAARFGRLVPEPVDRSPELPQPPELPTNLPTGNPQYPQDGELSTDFDHDPPTSGSQATHNSLTPDSQPAHTLLSKQASDVNIPREEHNRAEQRHTNASMQQEEERTPRREPNDSEAVMYACNRWAAAVAAVLKNEPPAAKDILYGCYVQTVAGDTVSVYLPKDRDRWPAVERLIPKLQAALRMDSQRPLQLVMIDPNNEASDGPEAADTS